MGRALAFFNRLFPVWVLAGCTLAFFRPEVFTGFPARHVTLFFGLTMFGIGVTLDLGQAVHSLRQVDKILLGVLAQYSIMPLLAYAITRAVDLHPAIAVGLVLTGCMPGAMSSNVLTYIVRGDVAYSVSLTTVSTLLSPWVTPALTLLLLGNRVPIPYVGMMITILNAVVIPLGLGLAFRRMFLRRIGRVVPLFPTLSILAIVVICSVVVARNVEMIRVATVSLFAVIVMLNGLGLAGGLAFGRLIRLAPAGRRTLAIEIGMQNAGMGVVLALTHFQDQQAVALPSALFAVWCIVTASIFTLPAFSYPESQPQP